MRDRFIRLTPRSFILGILVVLLVAAGIKAWRILTLASRLAKAGDELAAVADMDPSEIDLSRMGLLAADARADAAALRDEVAVLRPLTDRLDWIPTVGPAVAAAGPLTDYVAGLTRAADELLAGLAPAWNLSDPASGTSLSQRAFSALLEAQSHIAAASEGLEAAQEARAQFAPESLPLRLRDPLTRLDPLLPVARQGVQMIMLLPELLGRDGPQTYLLLAQNHDELRATGGFVSGVGLLVVERGSLVEVTIRDSYAVDDFSKRYPPPPGPLHLYMGADYWLVRDSNWSPDFPTAARQAQDLYTLSTDIVTDGVIAFDQTAIRRVLSVVGPVDVPGAPLPVSSENVETYMQQAWGALPEEGTPAAWWSQRKQFMSALGAAIVEKVQSSGEQGMIVSLAREAYKLIREKHILLYLSSAAAQSRLEALGLDGGVHPGEADYLMVVDSNVGFNKVDPMISRSLLYRVDLSDPTNPSGQLRISYEHSVEAQVPCEPGAFIQEIRYTELQRRCYWDYVRVYVPGDSEPISGSLPPIPGAWLLTGRDEPGNILMASGEEGTNVFAGILVLPPGETQTVAIHYRLPKTVLLSDGTGGWLYALRIQKQPGTSGLPVEVEVRLPQGFVFSPQAGWEGSEPGLARWSGRLWTDIDLQILLVRQ